MYPSRVIFEQSKSINVGNAGELIEKCFEEVYSPKHTLEELIAELESVIQSGINRNPNKYLSEPSQFGLRPDNVILRIDSLESLNLPLIINSKGKCLRFQARINYSEAILVGYVDQNFLIAKNDSDLWNDFTEVIYIPESMGFKVKSIKFME